MNMKRMITRALCVLGMVAVTYTAGAQNIPLEGFSFKEDTLYTRYGHTLWLPGNIFTPENATNKTVKYHLSDENAATFVNCDDGNPCQLRIRYDIQPFTLYGVTEDGGFMDSCRIVLEVREIHSVFEEITVRVGESKPFELEFVPQYAHNRRCTYEIDDAAICSVNASGMITGLKEGSTNVTATSVDGGHQVTTKVTVVAADVYIPEVVTLDTEYVVYLGGWATSTDNNAQLAYHDVDGDGVKERFCIRGKKDDTEEGIYAYRQVISWINMQGEENSKWRYEFGKNENQVGKYLLHDLNNDNVPDIFFWYGNTSEDPYYHFQILYSTPSGYTLQDAGFTLPYGLSFDPKLLSFGDFNRDGRVDIFHYETIVADYSRTYIPHLYLQMTDGTFERTPFPETTDEEAINNALYSTGGSGSFSINIPHTFNPAYFAKKPPKRDAPASTEQTTSTKAQNPISGDWQVLDLNQDGYLDIISEDGLSYLSLPDGTWYQAAIAGTVGLCDFNADGVKDLVIFDAATGQVDLLLSSADGLVKSSLYNNANITHVICEDMDADGKSDILLLAATNTHQYMLFFKNQGDGIFKRNERALAGEYEYKGLLHLSTSGTPSVVFKRHDEEACPIDDLKRIDWDKSFTLTESRLVPSMQYWTADDLPIFDYYGNGQFYASVSYGELHCQGTSTYSQNHIFLLSDAVTTAPAQVSQPNVIMDKASGLVKVEWVNATDAETSASDLDYEVRVTSNSHAIMLQSCTAGNNSLIFDPTTWALGDYTVQVRAIDKMEMAGTWSEAVSFTNTTQSAGFTISEKTLYLSDTLVVRSLSGETLSIQALPDGEILSNENGVARIIFHDLGDKTITASAHGVSSQQALYVEPFKTDNQNTIFIGRLLFDFNQDGKLEGWSGYWKEPGFYTLDKGIATTYPSLNLSDVQCDEGWVVDNNHDGLPDFIGRLEKNGAYYAVMENTGDMDFNILPEFTREEDGGTVILMEGYGAKVVDLDNDGLVDIFGSYFANNSYSKMPMAIYKNNGTNVLTRMTEESTNGVRNDIRFADVNNDGYIDMINYDSSSGSTYYYSLHLNNGNFEFAKQPNLLLILPKQVCDINYDGYKDLIGTEYNGTSTVWVAYLGSEDWSFTQKITLPGEPIPNDMDNDGRYDYIVKIDDTNYLYLDRKDGPVYAHVYSVDNLREIMYDIDEDGYPDAKNSIPTRTRFANTAPTAPTAVYVSQTDDEIIVNWEGASDKESHQTMLRYNLSVREKGTNYYVISPLNANKNEALTVHTTSNSNSHNYDHYRTATRFPIPASAFTLGKTYEICVQTIDSWFEHSDFSQVIEFTASKMLINLPAKGGVGLPVPFATNGGATATVIAEDGVVSENTITWNTAGNKTVTVIVGEEIATQTILIVEKPEIELALPAAILEGDKVTIDLPAVLAQPEYEYTLTCNDKNTRIELLDGAKAIIHASDKIDDGHYAEVTFTLKYQDPVFGTGQVEQTVQIHASVVPTIDMVTVEGTGVRVSWQTDALSAVYTGDVNIYRETTVADQYELVATVPFADANYLDETAVADVRSYRYVIALPTVYGTEGEQSAHHTTIHTMINQGMGNNVNLHWTHYEGAPVAQYTILSGTSPDNLTVLTNISGNAQSYTHKRSSDEDTYYALAYTLKSAMAAPSIVHRAPVATLEGRSNVICSNEAYNVTPVESISISSREGKMVLTNGTPQLHLLATVTPVRATLGRVAWSITAGEEYAAISSDGVLTLVATESASGTITVQAKAVDGSEVTATANIAFAYTASTAIAVTGVSLDVNGLTLNVGDVHTLTATVSPENATNKAVTWGSSDASVVSVQNGVLTAVATGTAVVTVSTVDGGFQAGCFVTVVNGTAVENVEANSSVDVRKVLEDGVIYILRGDEKYMIDGRKVE